MEKERGFVINKINWTEEMIEDLKNVEGFNPDKIYQEIEDIAWQIFQTKLGLTFKASFTAEDKKGITNKPEYEYYREEATKIYEKRQVKKEKALQNKKYPVIDVPASGKPRWIGGAYVLCFVYSKYKGNFVLRGYMKEVEDYLKKNYTHYFCNFSLWSNGFNRDIWRFWKDNINIFEPERHRRSRIIPNNKKYQVRAYSCSYESDEENKKRKENALFFKRLPKRWISEFNRF